MNGSNNKAVKPSIRPARTPRLYKAIEGMIEVVLYTAIIFAPWAFGSTQPWSILILNYMGFAIGLLYLAKRFVCWKNDYVPLRWEYVESVHTSNQKRSTTRRRAWFTLVIAPILLLLYGLIAALNARATYNHEHLSFTYHSNIFWLPHSYDSRGTWKGLWSYLALYCFFWATRDWLLGKTRRERHMTSVSINTGPILMSTADVPPPFQDRLQRLLWVLCLNGAILGLVSVLQRLDGTDKLLWLIKSKSGDVTNHFGPYAYRSNAAQYFNLLWPICFGFWWSLHHWHRMRLQLNPRLGSGPHLLLLPVTILITACPIISTSRGGALLCITGLPLVLLVFYFSNPRGRYWTVLAVLVTCLLGIGLYLGWAPLQKRLTGLLNISQDISSMERITQYASTWKMFTDYPVFGIGPNAYEAIYPLYRTPGQAWYPFAHNDWLQILVEWGVLGFIVILAGLIVCLRLPFLHNTSVQPLTGFFLVSFLLLFTHATIDFPFQVPSIFLTCVVLIATYTCLNKAPQVEH